MSEYECRNCVMDCTLFTKKDFVEIESSNRRNAPWG